MLDHYIVEDLYPYWEKIGKGLHLEEDFSQESYDSSQINPAERLKFVLRKWRDTADNPSLATLDSVIKKLGMKSSIPGNRTSNGCKELYIVMYRNRGSEFE